MNKLLEKHKIQIECELYTQVMLLIESQYNVEKVIDINKKDSTKIVFKDKKAAIQMVAEQIEEFSKENDIDKHEVKDYLVSLIEERVKSKSEFNEEFEEAKEIISTIPEQEER